MVKVGFINRSPDIKIPFNRAVVPVTKTVNSSVRANRHRPQRRRRGEIAGRSYLPALRTAWLGLTDDEKNAWIAAAAVDGRLPWHFFVSDTSARWSAGLSGVTNITEFHAGRVGHVELSGTATQITISQEHKLTHRRMQRVVGSKSQQVPTTVQEVLSLPLTIGCCYRSNLTAVGPNPYAKLYARVTTAHKGTNPTTDVVCILALVSGWASCEQTLYAVAGYLRNYSLNLELHDVTGTLEFDYMRAEHGGTNFAYDFRCDNIARGFSNANYQLPPPWTPVDVPLGATYSSVYPSDSDL